MKIVSIVLCLFVAGCKVPPIQAGGVAVDASAIFGRFKAVEADVDNICARVQDIEAAVVRIDQSVNAIRSSQEVNADKITSALANYNSGPFSGGGGIALIALGIVLIFEIVILILWWRLGRSVKRNGVICKDHPDATVAKRPTSHPHEYPAREEALT